jgi:chitinase
VAAAEQVLQYLGKREAGCKSTVAFASSGNAVVGVFAGAQLQAQGLAESVLRSFIDQIHKDGISDSTLVQFCGSELGSDYMLGVVLNANSSLPYVQSTIRSWSDGKCVTAFDGEKTWNKITFQAPVLSSNGTINGTINVTAHSLGPSSFHRRADCTTIQVASGDGCGSLVGLPFVPSLNRAAILTFHQASKCGISGNDFTTYNPAPNFCSGLKVDQHVCCSSGTLPDFTPKPNPDGSCATYLVTAGGMYPLIHR